jgi:hypothetical protein
MFGGRNGICVDGWRRRAAVALVALLASGCLRVRAGHSTITAASADATQTGFGLGRLGVTMSMMGASSATSSTYVEHAAQVRAGSVDSIWRTRIVSPRGALFTLEALELCDSAAPDQSCVGATLVDLAGASTPLQAQPVLLEPANLGTSQYLSAGTSTYAGGTSTMIVATGSASTPRSHPSTPNFGTWVLGAPVTALIGGFGSLFVGGGMPMFCHAPDPAMPICRAAPVPGVRAVLGVHLLRRGGDLIHVAWFQPITTETSPDTSIVRCEASDRDGQPTCRTIEVP